MLSELQSLLILLKPVIILLLIPILNFALSFLVNTAYEQYKLKIPRFLTLWLAIGFCWLLAFLSLDDSQPEAEKIQQGLFYVGIFITIGFTLHCLYILIRKPQAQTTGKNTTRENLIEQVNREIENRLENSLHNRIYIVVDKQANPGQVELPWAGEIRLGSEQVTHLQNTPIQKNFERPDIGGRLLILGAPGAGKTTTLLKLAEGLIKQAQKNQEKPIPVLFSLSAWKQDNQSIKDWLIERLRLKYGARQDIAQQLVEAEKIIPLLDGLDELDSARQPKCVEKLNQFLHPGNWRSAVVVCSRTEECQNHQQLLLLNNSLELLPLTPPQVSQYLHDTGNNNLAHSFNQDSNLCDLATKPLFLSIIVLAAQEISLEKWSQFNSSEERLSYLFDAYIRRMFKREWKGKKYTEENSKYWLSWLAQRLIEEKETEFLIERIQPDWLLDQRQKHIYNFIYGLILGLMVGLILGLIYELILGLIYGLIFWLIYGLILGLIRGLIYWWKKETTNIKTVEKLKIDRDKLAKSFFNYFIFGLIFWLIYGLIFWLIYGLISGLMVGLIVGLMFGLISGLMVGLDKGLIKLEIENKTIPNQGIWSSVINGGIIFSILCPFLALLSIIFILILQNYFPLEELQLIWYKSLIFTSPFALFLSINLSGLPAIEHFILRLFLWSNGYIPWNYAEFLDYATNRLFLQRVGGGYRFIHDLLRTHFATKISPEKRAQGLQQ